MSNFTRYLLASAGIETTDALVTGIEEIAREAAPISGLSSLAVIEAAVQVIAAYGVAEQFKVSMRQLETQAGETLEQMGEISQALLDMGKEEL